VLRPSSQFRDSARAAQKQSRRHLSPPEQTDEERTGRTASHSIPDVVPAEGINIVCRRPQAMKF
jgi:hypothetical protein